MLKRLKMTAQVKFITKFEQSFEKLKELEEIQLRIEMARAELSYIYRLENDYQKALGKMRFHNAFRDKWELIDCKK
jgi:hypothetical protein